MTVDAPDLPTVLPVPTAQGAGIAAAAEPAGSVAADLPKAARLTEALPEKAGIKNAQCQKFIGQRNPKPAMFPLMK